MRHTMAVQDRYKTYLPDQRRYYDELITEDWETYLYRELFSLWRFEVRMLFRWVRPATILNLGCGCGFHDVEMARRPFVKRIDAVDYSSRSIEQADNHYPHPKVHRRVADFYTLEGPDPYDLVVSFQVIEHVEDAERFLDLCRRLCRPEGNVALFTANRLRPHNRIRMRHGRPAELEDPMHKQEFSREELRELGARTGLTPVKVFTYGLSGLWRPYALGLWAGYFFPSRGTRLGALYRKSHGDAALHE